MGGWFSSLWSYWWPPEQMSVMLTGLDAAGKTTLLYRLKLNEVVTASPSFSWNVETINHAGVDVISWDLGGRVLIYHHDEGFMRTQARKAIIPKADALVCVIDSTDRQRLHEASEDLYVVVEKDDLPPHAPILLLANKQDLPNKMSITEIADAFKLEQLKKTREAMILPSVATDATGLPAALDWVCAAVRRVRASGVATTAKAAAVTTVKPAAEIAV